jgi:hypothetical protein
VKEEQRAEPRRSDRDEIGPDEASRLIKKYAAQQKIRIELTEEQMTAILKQWDDQNPRAPAEITFYVGDRATAELQVASYRYRGDTCCV